MDIAVLKALAIALGLGLLVGLQRERTASSRIAGVRTFPMVTVFGTLSALLAQHFGGWILAASAVALAVIVAASDIAQVGEGSPDHGLTTEIAMLLMFGVGAYLALGGEAVAVVIGGGVAVLLHLKGPLHGIAARLGDNDVKAIMQFALVSLVILPVLPDQAYGPYSVLNPRAIWMMVVLIVGINLGIYIVYKFFGQKTGTVAGGVLGGLISSTATTVSYARKSKPEAQSVSPLAAVIMISSTMAFARVLLIIGVVARTLLPSAAAPMILMLALFAAISLGVWYWGQREGTEIALQNNPTEMRPALLFGLLYAAALFAVAAAKAHFGSKGLYVVAAASGLTDVDAITLSTSQLFNSGHVDGHDAWRLILVALLTNLVFKAGTVAFLGARRLFGLVSLLYGVATIAGIVLLWFWP
jgi:uncharacterized membrane protein (DUF4010 family)